MKIGIGQLGGLSPCTDDSWRQLRLLVTFIIYLFLDCVKYIIQNTEGTQVSDCPLPCRSTIFVSSLIATEQTSFNDSSIEITFENTVAIYKTDFAQFTLLDFLATVGGSSGLWLGMGAFQK